MDPGGASRLGFLFAPLLDFTVEQIDKLTQPPKAAPVESKTQPRKLLDVGLIRFHGVGRRQIECSAGKDVLEFAADSLQ